MDLNMKIHLKVVKAKEAKIKELEKKYETFETKIIINFNEYSTEMNKKEFKSLLLEGVTIGNARILFGRIPIMINSSTAKELFEKIRYQSYLAEMAKIYFIDFIKSQTDAAFVAGIDIAIPIEWKGYQCAWDISKYDEVTIEDGDAILLVKN
jgi:hypothetical protein